MQNCHMYRNVSLVQAIEMSRAEFQGETKWLADRVGEWNFQPVTNCPLEKCVREVNNFHGF